MKEITQKFNLPKYIHGKSFAEASKIIEGKFKGRTDKEAMDTKEDLMSRLRDAQEYVKELQAYKEKPAQPEGPTHTMPDGTEMPGAQHQMGYGGYKETNDYPHGGAHDKPRAKALENFLTTYEAPYAAEGNPQFNLEDSKTPIINVPKVKTEKEREDVQALDSQLEIFREPKSEQRLNNSYTDGKKDRLDRGIKEFEKYGTDQLNTKTEAISNGIDSLDPIETTAGTTEAKGLGLTKALTTAGGLVPSAMNLAQLAMLKKPEQYRGAKINSTYDKQMTDEAAMQNAQNVENAGQRNAMRANSGSQSMLLSNLRGQGLNALKGQGAAYAQSVANNQQERKNENAFNAQKEATNVAFSRQDDEINARNEGAYDTTKSELMAGLATDVGKMSKEALFKKYPELMGMDYDWIGEFMKNKKASQNKSKK
jgi:hypothetical protein